MMLLYHAGTVESTDSLITLQWPMMLMYYVGAVESTATTLPEIIQEMLLCKTSERQGRMIDKDKDASMEKKKKEGYF